MDTYVQIIIIVPEGREGHFEVVQTVMGIVGLEEVHNWGEVETGACREPGEAPN